MFLACSFIHQTIVFCQFPCGVPGALFSSQTLCPTKALAAQGGASKAMGPPTMAAECKLELEQCKQCK